MLESMAFVIFLVIVALVFDSSWFFMTLRIPFPLLFPLVCFLPNMRYSGRRFLILSPPFLSYGSGSYGRQGIIILTLLIPVIFCPQWRNHLESYHMVFRVAQQFIACFNWWSYRAGIAKAGTSTLVWSGIIKTTAFIVLSPP
jgi:hypothetical protein